MKANSTSIRGKNSKLNPREARIKQVMESSRMKNGIIKICKFCQSSSKFRLSKDFVSTSPSSPSLVGKKDWTYSTLQMGKHVAKGVEQFK